MPNKEIPSAEGSETLEVGDVKEFYVLREENDEDGMLLSLKRLAFAQAWAQLNDAKLQGDTTLQKLFQSLKAVFLLT